MNQRIVSSIRHVVLLAIAVGALCGCDDSFYLSEAEVNGYRKAIRNASLANSTFANLYNQLLSIQFTGSAQPDIASTNLFDVIQNGTYLPGFEVTNRQINLQRLTTELEHQLQSLVRERLNFFQGESSEHVRIEELKALTVRFKSVPAFTYDAGQQRITAAFTIRLTIQGTLGIHGVDSWLSRLLAGPIDGQYPMTIIIDNYAINAHAYLLEPYADAARIRLRMNAVPFSIVVNSPNAPPDIINVIRLVLLQKLSAGVDDSFDQAYDYFSLTGLKLLPPVGQTPAELAVRYEAMPDLARPSLHVVARDADRRLYHARKNGSTWTAFEGPLFPAANVGGFSDPTLISSGEGQLELAATTTVDPGAGQLFYAHLRDGAWVDTAQLLPASRRFIGKPAVVASAPGQVEVFVAVENGGIAHLRKVNGRWLQQTMVPTPPEPGGAATYSRPAAVIAGSNVVVLYVNHLNQLRASVFDLETSLWSGAQQLSGRETVQFTPAIAASGENRVDIVYVGSSGAPRHIQVTVWAASSTVPAVLVPFPETAINGITLTAQPSLVATGFEELELVGRGTDNRLRANHYSGRYSWTGLVYGRTIVGGWQGWDDLTSFLEGAPFSLTADRMDSFAAAGTPGGTVELVSLGTPGVLAFDPNPYLYHNTFDSGRYAEKDWKATHWRGYERIHSRIFHGQPAIAATDNHVELGFVGNSGRPRHAKITERNNGRFDYAAATVPVQAKSFPSPVADPAMVISGPGIVDYVLPITDGTLAHIRNRNDGAAQVTVFDWSYSSRPALVGYGSGQLDLVALKDDGLLYHRRYINGAWTLPTALSGTANLSPVLRYTGAGQLELLTIGADQKLYRRRFVNRVWSSPLQLPGTFLIDAAKFGPQSVSSWGMGTMDVLVAGTGAGNLYHRRIGPHDDTVASLFVPARSFNPIGGPVSDIPNLIAASPTHLHLVIRGEGNAFYSNESYPDTTMVFGPMVAGADARIRWNGFRFMGSGLYFGGIVKTGDTLAVVGIDTQSQPYINRFRSGAWTGFRRVYGFTSAMRPPAKWQLFRPTVSSYGGVN